MAGSMRWFTYVDDAGLAWGVFADESNTELVNSANLGVPPVGTTRLPQGVTPRYARYRGVTNAALTRKITLLTATDYAAAIDAIGTALAMEVYPNAPAQQMVLIGVVPEKRSRQPIQVDTGLNDGDNP